MSEQPTDPRSASTPAAPAASAPDAPARPPLSGPAAEIARHLAHSHPYPAVVQDRPARFAEKGTQKYIDQAWAGLIHDPEVVDAERQRRAQAARDVEERRRRLRSVDANLVRDVLSAARARGEG